MLAENAVVRSNYAIGMTGVYWVCYVLSTRDLIAVPTSRNADAVDVLVSTRDGSSAAAMQVKTQLMKRAGAIERSWPLRSVLDPSGVRRASVRVSPDYFFVFVRISSSPTPEVFLVPSKSVLERANVVVEEQLRKHRLPEKTFPAFELRDDETRYRDLWERWRGEKAR